MRRAGAIAPSPCRARWLDNLTFVISCNLQRLDGPVRGNSKVIQELESIFRAPAERHQGHLGREWDPLLAQDADGVLVNQMNTTNDGSSRSTPSSPRVHPRALLRSRPRLRKLVAHLSDDDLPRLRRGGHDYRKLYSAYKLAVEQKEIPTVILAHTIKGWTSASSSRAQRHAPAQEVH